MAKPTATAASAQKKHETLTERDARGAIDLSEGEEIQHVTGRHWVELLIRLLIPFTLIVGCGVVAIYRAIGGDFIVPGAVEAGQFDRIDTVLSIAIGGVVLFYLYWLIRFPKQITIQRWLIGIALTLAIIVIFRYQGGRVFDLATLAPKPLDLLNIILYAIIAVLLIFCGYVYINWANDELILTNRRVISDDDQIYIPRYLERKNQQQLLIEDIQSVTATTKTYLQHYLKYGNIIVKSATAGRDIVFKAAIQPAEMQAKIDQVRRDLQKQASEASLRNRIEATIYKKPQPKPKPARPKLEKPFWLRYLYEREPKLDPVSNVYEYRLRDIFTLQALLIPLLTLGFAWTTLFIASIDEMPEWAALLLMVSMVPIAFFLWSSFAEENPEYDPDKRQFTWRPHWMYFMRALLWPLGGLALGWVLLLLAARSDVLAPNWFITTMIFVLLGFVVWAAWQIEDYRNDLYILTPTNVIDIEKKPFGPEDRKNAGLGALQNVSFKTTFFSNFFNYGDVLLETAGGGGGKFTFTHVPNPRDVTNKVNEYRAAFKKEDAEKTRNEMIALLRFYHEAQQTHNELRVDNPEG